MERKENIKENKKVEIIETTSEGLWVKMFIPMSKDMLTTEESIQEALNQTGIIATEQALSRFDTDGTPIMVSQKKYTSKGQISKTYQSPFGEFELNRHVYQSTEGGKTYCPLDNDARIIVYSTPKFAKMVSCKSTYGGSQIVQKDLEENHDRRISRNYIQAISQSVGELASKKSMWEYRTEVEEEAVNSIGISLDGTCMLMREDGWRQAMVGSISYYDENGERLHTQYIANAPEYGKGTFYKNFEKEISRVKKRFQGKLFVGVADGAADNWIFLKPHVDCQVLDYFHASEYLSKASKAAFKRKADRSEWFKDSCHRLKHEDDGAKVLLKEMQGFLKKKITAEKKEEISQCITYFTNHIHHMKYPEYLAKKIPIGSGVIEAACKVIIKQRMCNSGMRWSDSGAKNILILRCFNETDGKWKQFWDKINKFGI
jgi:hypothetical protein